MRIPDAGPLGETFFEARLRAITGALFVNNLFGGCVESVVTWRTQRFFGEDLFPAEEEFFFTGEDFFSTPEESFAVLRRAWVAIRGPSLVPFKVLHGALMLLGLLAAGKSAQVAALAGGGVLLAGIQPIFAGFEFADHTEKDAAGQPGAASDSSGSRDPTVGRMGTGAEANIRTPSRDAGYRLQNR